MILSESQRDRIGMAPKRKKKQTIKKERPTDKPSSDIFSKLLYIPNIHTGYKLQGKKCKNSRNIFHPYTHTHKRVLLFYFFPIFIHRLFIFRGVSDMPTPKRFRITKLPVIKDKAVLP